MTGMRRLGQSPPPMFSHAAARQGAALIIVVGALVVMLVALAPAMLDLTTARQVAVTMHQQVRIDALRADAETALAAWCDQHGAMMVTDPDAPPTGHLVIDVVTPAQAAPGGAASVRIRAWVWDAYAAWPAQSLRPGHALARSRPAELATLSLPSSPPRPLGDIALWLDVPDDQSRWPRLGSTDFHGDSLLGYSVFPQLAMHGEERINLRTAPIELVEATASALDLPNVAAVLDARRDGVDLPIVRHRSNNTKRRDLTISNETDRWVSVIIIDHAAASIPRQRWVAAWRTRDDAGPSVEFRLQVQ